MSLTATTVTVSSRDVLHQLRDQAAFSMVSDQLLKPSLSTSNHWLCMRDILPQRLVHPVGDRSEWPLTAAVSSLLTRVRRRGWDDPTETADVTAGHGALGRWQFPSQLSHKLHCVFLMGPVPFPEGFVAGDSSGKPLHLDLPSLVLRRNGDHYHDQAGTGDRSDQGTWPPHLMIAMKWCSSAANVASWRSDRPDA
jgi:hypothetical protein